MPLWASRVQAAKRRSQAQVNSESRKHLAESKRYIVSDLRVKCISESITENKQFARVVFSKVHICSCVPRRCVWQTTHFLRQLNCAVEPNGGDYGRCWVSPRSSKKPPRPMVRRREISLEIFSETFIFASHSKHKKTIKIFGWHWVWPGGLMMKNLCENLLRKIMGGLVSPEVLIQRNFMFSVSFTAPDTPTGNFRT